MRGDFSDDPNLKDGKLIDRPTQPAEAGPGQSETDEEKRATSSERAANANVFIASLSTRGMGTGSSTPSLITVFEE